MFSCLVQTWTWHGLPKLCACSLTYEFTPSGRQDLVILSVRRVLSHRQFDTVCLVTSTRINISPSTERLLKFPLSSVGKTPVCFWGKPFSEKRQLGAMHRHRHILPKSQSPLLMSPSCSQVAWIFQGWAHSLYSYPCSLLVWPPLECNVQF